MILAGRLADEKEVKRFRLEAEAAASLAHPNIVSIYEVGEYDGQPYFSMRYVEGRSLHRIVEDGSWKLDDGRAAARLLAKVARAVHFAHERGIVHRDLKPGNILLDAQGEPHITDFGLARLLSSDSTLTLSGSIMGTPSFMAPEQAAGKFHRLTPAADLYSLGAVLYYLLTGRPPFLAETPLDILVQLLDRDALRPRALNPKVSRDLERICLRCLEKSPGRRYASSAALAENLESFLRGEPVEAALEDTGSRVRQWVRREPALVARLLALAICAAASQVAYQLGPPGNIFRHVKVMSALGLWAAASLLCHRALARQRWADFARFAWAGADGVLLTAVLHIVDALESPLVALYPGLIACSGLWLRVSLVRLTTQLCALGYASLLLAEYVRLGFLQHPHWHFIFFVVLALTGFIVAYHVHRLSVLGRFSESRSTC
jgi:serine/threonine-protein kinase